MTSSETIPTDDNPGTTRRTFLFVSGAGVLGAGALVLAGCGSSDSATSASSGSPSSGSTPESPTGSPSASASSSPSAAGGAPLAKVADVPKGGAVAAKLDGKPIIIARSKSGQVTAHSAICTHRGCPVAPSGATLNCPCHGSSFNAFTGAVLNGPAASPLPAVSVKVSGANIVAS